MPFYNFLSIYSMQSRYLSYTNKQGITVVLMEIGYLRLRVSIENSPLNLAFNPYQGPLLILSFIKTLEIFS